MTYRQSRGAGRLMVECRAHEARKCAPSPRATTVSYRGVVSVNGPNAANGSSGDFKAQVLAATNIVELIGQSVALKRRGSTFVGLCPFHQEKTPSFHVNPTRQYFHCFGCKESGNAIDFVMKRDRVEFIDALRTLGQLAGLEMPKYAVSREKTSQRQQLL
jgi:hypothetical protein